MNCLDNLIYIPDPCSTVATSCNSSFNIEDMRGWSWGKGAKIAQDRLIDAEAILYNIRGLAVKRFSSDFMAYLASNGYQLSLADTVFNSTKKGTVHNGFAYNQPNKLRGIKLSQKTVCSLKKIHIKQMCILGQSTGNFTVVIYNGGLVYNLPVSLVAGQKYCITEADLCAYFPNGLFARNSDIYIGIDGTDFNGANFIPDCNCGGTSQNTCATIAGFDGNIFDGQMVMTSNNNTTYGFEVLGACECNWDLIICNLASSSSVLGQLLFYLCEKFFIEKIIYTDRLNLFTIFGKEQATNLLPVVEAEYSKLFDVFISGISSYIQGNNLGECIKCNNAITFKTNY